MEIIKKPRNKQDDDLFDLIRKTNEFLRQVHPEILHVNRLTRDAYRPRFGELENIVPNPVDFSKAVLALGNYFKM